MGETAGSPSARRVIVAGAVVIILSCSGATAKDLLRRWYFGGSLGYHVTFDGIENDAESPGDPRPDDLVGRETSVEDGLAFGLTAGFGMTSWLSLQLDASYHKGGVGPVSVFFEDTFPRASNPLSPENLNQVAKRSRVVPVDAGDLTQIGVSLSGIVRFRKDSALSPYLGAGAGRIFNEVDVDPGVVALNGRIASQRIFNFKDESGKSLVPPFSGGEQFFAILPNLFPVTVEAEDAWEFHLSAGAEYAFNDRVGLSAEIRYTRSDQDLIVNLAGQDQVHYEIWSEQLFRPDGSVKLFRDSGFSPNPFTNDPNDPWIRCFAGSIGDFDKDGHADDLCYDDARFFGANEVDGTFIVQGGRIDLSGVLVSIGVRFYF